MSPRTIETYTAHVSRLALHHGCNPANLDNGRVRAYFEHLVNDTNHSLAACHHPDVPRARDEHSRKVLALIEDCRSGRLGAGIRQCLQCPYEELTVFICRDRHTTRHARKLREGSASTPFLRLAKGSKKKYDLSQSH